MCCSRMDSGSPFKIHSCIRASSGVIRFVGFHSKHLLMRLRKERSVLPTIS